MRNDVTNASLFGVENVTLLHITNLNAIYGRRDVWVYSDYKCAFNHSGLYVELHSKSFKEAPT